MKYDDSHGEPHYHGLARLVGKKPQGKVQQLKLNLSFDIKGLTACR
jgi:hypothetical protein